MENKKILVMVNGLSCLSGKMATCLTDHINLDPRIANYEDINLIPYSLTGPGVIEDVVMGGAVIKNPIFLVKPEEREERIKKIKSSERQFISVDFTQPDSVNENADFYCRHNLPFVMGTTGGDRKALEERVKNSDICAVIAPNMAKQIVAFQSLMEDYANENPGRLEGCTLQIMESHQKTKIDTSGTAKAMVFYFNKLGIPFTVEQIKMIRDPAEQKKLGVPEEYLKGHAWHNYIIKSKDFDTAKSKAELNKCYNRNLYDLGGILENFVHSGRAFSEYGKSSDFKFDESKQNRVAFQDRAVSPDRTVAFLCDYMHGLYVNFSHNVNGRAIYADGTLDAIKFLNKKVQAGEHGKVYSMIDVLREGN
jgi:4-hydroxy-tetrahydrodipicolinate reductase